MPSNLRRVQELTGTPNRLNNSQILEIVDLVQNFDLNYQNLSLIVDSQQAVIKSGDFARGNDLRNFLLSYIRELQQSSSKPTNFREYQIQFSSIYEYEKIGYQTPSYLKNFKANVGVLKLHRQSSNVRKYLSNTHGTSRNVGSQISNYIFGKNVLLLGPAPIGELHLNNFEKFDVVAQINIKSDKRSNSFIPKPLPKIIYLNGQLTSSFKIENYKQALGEGTIFIRRNPFSNNLLNDSPETLNINLLQFSTPLLMAPRVLLDLISYSPKSIEIQGLNFYCSQSRYYDGFKKASSENIVEILEHDLVSSFNFMRYLISHSQIPISYDKYYFDFTMPTNSFFNLLAQTFSNY